MLYIDTQSGCDFDGLSRFSPWQYPSLGGLPRMQNDSLAAHLLAHQIEGRLHVVRTERSHVSHVSKSLFDSFPFAATRQRSDPTRNYLSTDSRNDARDFA